MDSWGSLLVVRTSGGGGVGGGGGGIGVNVMY